MICKEISVGSLLKHAFRGWLGNRKGTLSGEQIFSGIGRKSWDLREGNEEKTRQEEGI